MIIKITEVTTIADFQEEFAKRFPHLKVEFYKTTHEPGEGSHKKDQLPVNITFGNAIGSNKKGVMNINGLMKVSEMEQQFIEIFGISAQVFRQSGDTWLQTTATDNWALAEQNSRGRESLNLPEDTSEPMNYREQS